MIRFHFLRREPEDSGPPPRASASPPALVASLRVRPWRLCEPEERPSEPCGSPPARPLYAMGLGSGGAGELLAAMGPALEAGREVYCLDGGCAFNPLPLAARLRAAGSDPGPVLERRLFVSRAFTCHQLAGAVSELLAPLAARPDPPAAIVLAADRLFLDEDLPLFERRHLFERILREITVLARRGLPALVVHGPGGPENPWARRVAASARALHGPEAFARRLESPVRDAGAGEGSAPAAGLGRTRA